MVIHIQRIIIKILLVLSFSFGLMKEGLAATYQDRIYKDTPILDIYVTKKHDGRTWHDYLNFLRRQSDGQWVYCIQPGVAIDSNANYTGTDQDMAQATKLTSAQLKRIELLAYYGYTYNENGYNHSPNRWYAITQFLIWQTAGPDWDIYFTSGLGGAKIADQFAYEIAELEMLVANHNKIPNFGADKFRLDIEDTMTLTDENKVLSYYEVNTNPEALTLVSDNNSLTITAHMSGKTTIELTKSTKKWRTSPIVYVNPDSQNVFTVGNFTPVKTTLELEVFSGQIIIEKVGEAVIIEDGTYHYQEIILPDVVFGLYDENDQLFTSGSTNDQGLLIFNNLKLGKHYYVKEISSSNQNLIDPNIYDCLFEEPEAGTYLTTINFYFKNYLPKGTLELTKIDEKSGERIPETMFEVYTEQGELIYTGITDTNGQIIIKDLFAGSFYIKEVGANPAYYLSDQIINFNITNDSITEVQMTNLKIPVPNTGIDMLASNNHLSFLKEMSLIIDDKKRKK